LPRFLSSGHVRCVARCPGPSSTYASTPSLHAALPTPRRVTPSKAPRYVGGVITRPFFTINTLSPVHSHTYPSEKRPGYDAAGVRSEARTSELQSRENLVCRLLLARKSELHRNSLPKAM